jgi:MT0933-like antitoxin protein
MSDQPPDQPPDQPGWEHALRGKMQELGVDRHLQELASTVESAVREGLARAGDLVHDHRGDIDRLLDQAAGLVDRHTDGRHGDRITQVRGSLERGVERLAEQRPGGPGDVPPSNG